MNINKTFNPCDECEYSYSKQNQESGMCKICEFKAALHVLYNKVDYAKHQKQTNADRIRSMSDEELADYIFGVSVHEKPCVLCSDDCDFCELTDEECKNKTLQWLQSEVEG